MTETWYIYCLTETFRYDPNIDVPMDVDGQNDRVIFIKSIAQFMVSFDCCYIWQMIMQIKYLGNF